MKQKLVDKKYIAEMLGIKPNTVVKMAQVNAIPHYKLGHRLLRFDLQEIESWVEKRKVVENPLRGKK